MKKLIIAHFSQDFQKNKPQLGGYSRIINICKDGNAHIVFTIEKKAEDIETWFVDESIQVVSLPLFGKEFTLREQIKIYKKLGDAIFEWLQFNSIKPDLLFSHSQLVNYYILNRVKQRIPNLKLLWETNAIWGIHRVKGFIQKISINIVFLLQKNILKSADYIISQTESSKTFVVDRFNISSDKITVIENAILPVEITPINELPLYNYLCFGLFDKMNGIPFILDYVKSQTQNTDIHFYGNGFYVEEVKTLSQNGSLTYHGSLSKDKMLVEIKKFKYVIIPRLPELEADLFIPTKLIECMANGIVPICSNVKGMSEIVKHRINGFIFNAGDKQDFEKVIEEIKYIDEPAYKSMQKAALKTIFDNYLWPEKHKKLNEIYRKFKSND